MFVSILSNALDDGLIRFSDIDPLGRHEIECIQSKKNFGDRPFVSLPLLLKQLVASFNSNRSFLMNEEENRVLRNNKGSFKCICLKIQELLIFLASGANSID